MASVLKNLTKNLTNVLKKVLFVESGQLSMELPRKRRLPEKSESNKQQYEISLTFNLELDKAWRG